MILREDSKFFACFNVRWSQKSFLEISFGMSLMFRRDPKWFIQYSQNCSQILWSKDKGLVRRMEVQIVDYFSLHCSQDSWVSTKINPFYVKATWINNKNLYKTQQEVSTLVLIFFLHFKILCHVQQTAAFNMFFVISVFWFCSSSCNLHNKGDILFILFTTKIEVNFVIRMHLTVRCLGFVARVLCQRCSFSFKVKIGMITK